MPSKQSRYKEGQEKYTREDYRNTGRVVSHDGPTSQGANSFSNYAKSERSKASTSTQGGSSE
jgi:hypothetical protein